MHTYARSYSLRARHRPRLCTQDAAFEALVRSVAAQDQPEPVVRTGWTQLMEAANNRNWPRLQWLMQGATQDLARKQVPR